MTYQAGPRVGARAELGGVGPLVGIRMLSLLRLVILFVFRCVANQPHEGFFERWLDAAQSEDAPACFTERGHSRCNQLFPAEREAQFDPSLMAFCLGINHAGGCA